MSHYDTLWVHTNRERKTKVALLHYWWLTVVDPALEALITVNYHYWSQTNVIPEDLSPTAEEMIEKLHKHYRQGQKFSEYEFHTHMYDRSWLTARVICPIDSCVSEVSVRGRSWDEGICLWSLLQSSCISDLLRPAQPCWVLYHFIPSKGAFTLMAVKSQEVSKLLCCVSCY